MTVFHAFGRGWMAAGRTKLALVLMWFTYALIAKLVALPALLWLLAPLSHSRMADRLLSNFDLGWLAELGEPASAAVAALSAVGVLAAVLTWLVAVLFAGGVLTMLIQRWERFSLSLFLAAAGQHFLPILRLSFFGVLCYGIAWLIAHVPSIVAGKLYGKGMLGAPIGIAAIVSSVLAVLLWGWVATVLDYAKIRLVNENARGAFNALLRSFAFVVRHTSQTMGVWLMNALLFALVGLGYLLASKALAGGAVVTIVLLVILQQAFVLFRTAQRIAGWGAAIEIYATLKPRDLELAPLIVGAVPAGLNAEAEAFPEPAEWEGFAI